MNPARTGCSASVALGLCLAIATGCGGGAGGGILPVPTDPVLADIQSRVFTPRCATSGCHVTGTAAFDMVLSTGQSAGNIIGIPSDQDDTFMRVDPGNAADSWLYMKVTADSRITGDPMPSLSSPLRQADLDMIRDWIDQGAQ